MSPIITAILVVSNLGLIFLLITVPLGLRTVRSSRVVAMDRQRLWQALWPLGNDAGWSGEILSAHMLDGEGEARIILSWEGRDGKPIERRSKLEDVVEGSSFTMRVIEDTALDGSFWKDYSETTDLASEGGGTRVTLGRTDRYRGVAFLVFRYFAMRRELSKLQHWAVTGQYRKGGWFEHPLSQVGFAVLSALILWPFFGLHLGGLALASILTSVVALHELGHMAAFRLMGHRKARMIFIPLLGGIAIGGRPYNSRFEVAFVALMGAGFSAFLVPIVIAASMFAGGEGHKAAAALLAALAGCAALFNIANLVPVWKFDGGQVLRQICPGPIVLALASFFLLSAFLALGRQAGFSSGFLIVAGAVFSILSLLTVGSGIKPRHELEPIRIVDRFAIAGALLAVFVIHGCGVLWASAQLI
ncbi:site-2 protease family protein [Mesorhizobium opportunistum]|uniref:Site-2 protease family protein n=1 Tax=Mesorhizobium opportunistum TaxID=593909 RepID=A0ABV1YNH0_9HYPH|nr:site-2 protease family protein [Mesorhizobium sp.]TIN92703.1 MAG: site-2 protease family protein [Mesorhizobium sp.]TJU95201.1 MAG: site-2 protease family protein [Mesorhizobium sp.]TJV17294.1 MAG: site-2 protease family protein [Mesorhizobium sp.]